MKKVYLFIVISLTWRFILPLETSAESFACYKIENRTRNSITHYSCFLTLTNDLKKMIDFKPVAHKITGLELSSNKRIEILPINVSNIFPQLENYHADSCSVKSISKHNFARMTELKRLWLGSNQIEKIPSDAFDDLTKLIHLALNGNKIKILNPSTFTNLKSLTHLLLANNTCINHNYFEKYEILKVPYIVGELCSEKLEEKCEAKLTRISDKWREASREIMQYVRKLEALKILVAFEVNRFRENLKSEKNREIAKKNEDMKNMSDIYSQQILKLILKTTNLEAELETSDSAKNEALGQVNIIRQSLKFQKDFDSKIIENLQSIIDLKNQQIQKQSIELIEKNESMKEKDRLIEYLKKKLENLS